MILDVESGQVIPQEQWQVGEEHVKLRLVVDPGAAFISDLDLYDQLADRIDGRLQTKS
jgi:hypothetical protein